MKRILFISILLSPLNAMAYQSFDPSHCHGMMSYVVQKVDRTHYFGYHDLGFGNYVNFLVVSKKRPMPQGKVYLPVKKIGSKVVPLQNGFQERVDVFQICDEFLPPPIKIEPKR